MSPWTPGSTSSARSLPSASASRSSSSATRWVRSSALEAWAAWPELDPRAHLRRRRAAGRASHPRASVGSRARPRRRRRPGGWGKKVSPGVFSPDTFGIDRKSWPRSSGCSRCRRSRTYMRCCRILLAANAEAIVADRDRAVRWRSPANTISTRRPKPSPPSCSRFPARRLSRSSPAAVICPSSSSPMPFAAAVKWFLRTC